MPHTLIPARFWVLARFAVLYSFCRAVNGRSQFDVPRELGATATVLEIALTAFGATPPSLELASPLSSGDSRSAPRISSPRAASSQSATELGTTSGPVVPLHPGGRMPLATEVGWTDGAR